MHRPQWPALSAVWRQVRRNERGITEQRTPQTERGDYGHRLYPPSLIVSRRAFRIISIRARYEAGIPITRYPLPGVYREVAREAIGRGDKPN